MTNGAVDGVGIPDRWQRLWAPHRMAYLSGENRPLKENDVSCPFCEIPKGEDESSLIVFRGHTAYVVLNLYPYNPGHLLICTYRHIADLTDLTNEEREELFRLTSDSMRVIRKVSKPGGFNLGMNQGDVSVAGVSEHIHHLVIPRWSGDANFMPLIGQTKVLPKLLSETRAELASAWLEIQ
ncbi:MAG: HIT family protein [Candidatus Nanopelagicaceae bacterium]